VSGESSGVGLDATLRDFSRGQKVFNRYTLIRTLGRGGMGIVWLAHDEVLDRDVALKFLPEIIIHDRAVLEDLKRETKRSLELTHKNIVRIHDFVHDLVSACISMEYIEGDTLSNLRADKTAKIFEPDELKPWLSQLCDALDYAHNHARIIHRDLKPSNLMISKRGHVKVADFGIARSLSDSVSMLTQARGTSGTLMYMSPQQLDGERGTHLDDIYSLGATIYELLTSRPPFFSGNIDRQIHEKVPPSMAERRKELEIEGEPIDERWEAIVARCLRKDPARRPQSIADVGRELDLSDHQTGSTRTKRRSMMGGEKVAETALGKVALGIIAGVVLFVLYFAATRHDSKDQQPFALQPNKLAVESQRPTPAQTASEQVASDSTPARQDDIAADVERQRNYLYDLISRQTAQGLKATPTPTITGGFAAITPVVSHQYDGTWKGKDSTTSWTAILVIKDGTSATITEELVEKLPPKSDHWNDIAPPYNRARTFIRRWTAESRLVQVTASGLNVYWNEWKLNLQPTTPLSALAKKMRQSPSPSWGLTSTGADLVTGAWTFRRKH
jgi:hypothetical protein